MSSKLGRTRREILADAAKAAAAAGAAGLASCFPSVGGEWPDGAPDAPPPPDGGGGSNVQCDPDAGVTASAESFAPVTPVVVEVYRENSIVSGSRATIDPAVVAEMLDVGLAALAKEVAAFNGGQTDQDAGADDGDAGTAQAQDASPWPTLLPQYQSGQRIGIKVNCLGVVVPTPFFIRALIAHLRDKLPIATSDLVVWDRFLEDVTGHGKYSVDDLAGASSCGTLVRGAKDGESEDDPQLTNGHGYGDSVCSGPRGMIEKTREAGAYPRLSRVLTHDTALTINCLSLKTHNISGVTGAIKSTYGMVHNPGEFHAQFMDVAPLLYAIPQVRKALPLTICDGILALMSGDPTRGSNATGKRLLFAQDPVAMDSYIVDVMNKLRENITTPVDPAQLTWLDKAEALGLGTRSYKLVQV